MTTKSISPKVAAGGAAGAAVTVLVYVTSLFGVDVPVEVATAAVVLVSFAVAYLVPDPLRRGGDHSSP